ncbi:sugar transferase [Dysgonomonas sp. 520]|uniref:sugar transferase n=1 Tax=Dysgonomonas sp. 520 TaxID=2302931 RepID=UPI0013D0B906|nr:sugar transferase [Dysgonomonas sp. 520]NDW09240.1 sugar transferase [Dysgonomonas sp. 520]
MSGFFSRNRFSYSFIFVDICIVYLSIFAAYFLFRDTLENFQNNYYAFLTISPYIGIAYIVLCHVFELDKPKEFSFFGVMYSVSLTIICLFFITMSIMVIAQVFAYPRKILLASTIFQVILLIPWHYYLNRRYFKKNIKKTSIIIGYGRTYDIAYKLLATKGLSSNIQHICKPEHPRLKEYILKYDVTFIAEDVNAQEKMKIIEFCLANHKNVLHVPTYPDIYLFNSRFTQLDDAPIFKVKSMSISEGNLFTKRIIDLLLSLIALTVFCIPMIIIAIALKVGGGSVFYKQERITKDNRIFKIIKFRTMVENAEELSGPVLAQDIDPRITKLGAILRATRMDELPQIFNILKGDMSIVGPRPERPYFVEKFTKEIPQYDLRHSVKAGLTGLAQVHGRYNTTVREKLKYDLMYINGYSLAEDIKLILQTLNILLKKDSTQGIKEQTDINEEIDALMED